MLTDIYVRDKETGRIHRIGDDAHDGLWIDSKGIVHYMNLQNGDGCGPNNPSDGYEFIATEYGSIPPYSDMEKYKDFIEQIGDI